MTTLERLEIAVRERNKLRVLLEICFAVLEVRLQGDEEINKAFDDTGGMSHHTFEWLKASKGQDRLQIILKAQLAKVQRQDVCPKCKGTGKRQDREKIARDLIRIVKLMAPLKAATFSAYLKQADKIQALFEKEE